MHMYFRLQKCSLNFLNFLTIIKYVDKKIQSVSCNTTLLCKHDGASHVDNGSYNRHVIKEQKQISTPLFNAQYLTRTSVLGRQQPQYGLDCFVISVRHSGRKPG